MRNQDHKSLRCWGLASTVPLPTSQETPGPQPGRCSLCISPAFPSRDSFCRGLSLPCARATWHICAQSLPQLCGFENQPPHSVGPGDGPLLRAGQPVGFFCVLKHIPSNIHVRWPLSLLSPPSGLTALSRQGGCLIKARSPRRVAGPHPIRLSLSHPGSLRSSGAGVPLTSFGWTTRLVVTACVSRSRSQRCPCLDSSSQVL